MRYWYCIYADVYSITAIDCTCTLYCVYFNECYCYGNCNIIVRYIGAVEVQMKGVQILMLITNTTVWLYYITVPPSHSSKISLIPHQYCVCRWFVPLFMGVNIVQGIRLLLSCKFVLLWLTHAPIRQPYSNSSSHAPISPLYHHIRLPRPSQKWSWEHHS